MTPITIGLTPILYIVKHLPLIGENMKVDMDEVDFVTETTLTIRGTRRRTTVPKSIVDNLDLKNGDKLRWIQFNDGSLLITKVRKV